MQVALLAHSAPRHDAVGNQVAEKALLLQERGCAVRVFLHTLDNLHPQLVRIAFEYRDTRSPVPPLAADDPTREYLSRCDLVLVEYSQYFPALGLLPLLAQKGVRIVADYHGITPPQLVEETMRPALQDGLRRRGILGCADRILTHSRYMSRELADALPFPREAIASLDLPIESTFTAGPRSGSLREQRNLQGRILLFVGRMAGNKRPRILIQALARLHSETTPYHAVFIGAARDLYAREVEACRDLAQQLGMDRQVHFLGQLPLNGLADAYRDADLLVLPSVHEGFCLPVREAMACGLPVLAARASALPETVGDAGLTFIADDAEDLAREVRRIFTQPECQTLHPSRPRRVALACFRFGAGIVGGAERSLRTIGEALLNQGFAVEVFTTCTRSESVWRDELQAGTTREGNLLVHRFPIDPHDRERHLKSLERLRQAKGVSRESGSDYLRHSIHSTALLDALAARQHELEAIITGPYLFGLTHDIATRFPGRTLLLPCFHDEPLARLPLWPEAYSKVGGLLYHTPEEQQLAQAELGINHPNSGVIGTWLEPVAEPSQVQGKAATFPRPHVVYCGRYSVEKNVPRVIEFATRYQTLHPDRFDFVFLGVGDVRIPRRAGLHDLGHVSEQRKSQVLRDAVALVQLSEHESLSLVLLEAWREGTPVLVSSRADVLMGQLRRSGGGLSIDGFDEFRVALDRLWEQPELRAQMGQAGREYVERTYLGESAFADRIVRHIDNLARPLSSLMAEKGRTLARQSSRAQWRERFSQWLDEVLHAQTRERTARAEIVASQPELTTSAGQSVLTSLIVRNIGTLPLIDIGPGAVSLVADMGDADTRIPTPLPRLLQPGETTAVAILLKAPLSRSSLLRVEVRCVMKDGTVISDPCFLTLKVSDAASTVTAPTPLPYLELTHRALTEAHAQQRLPDDYIDVTEGWFCRVKRWLKQKVLGNFRRAYVDVLSRQQSRFNEQLVEAVLQLTQHCATMEHALRTMQRKIDTLEANREDRSIPAERPTPSYHIALSEDAHESSQE